MRSETYELSKTTILSAITTIAAWEKWAQAVPRGPAKILNLSLIRLVKGLVKAWRIYLSDLGLEQNQNASSQRTAASFADKNKEIQPWENMESARTRSSR